MSRPVVDGQRRPPAPAAPALILREPIVGRLPVGEVSELPPEAYRLFDPQWQDTVPGDVEDDR